MGVSSMAVSDRHARIAIYCCTAIIAAGSAATVQALGRACDLLYIFGSAAAGTAASPHQHATTA